LKLSDVHIEAFLMWVLYMGDDLLTYLLTYLLIYLLSYLLRGAKYSLKI